MADPVTLGIAAVVVGAGAEIGASYMQGKENAKAASAANARAAAAADTAAAVSSSRNAANTTNTKQAATQSLDTSTQRRASLNKTVNKYSSNGLSRTLG